MISAGDAAAGGEAVLPSFGFTARSPLEILRDVFLGIPLVLSPFSTPQRGGADLRTENIYCEGGGSRRKHPPLYSTTDKSQGKWMEELVRSVHLYAGQF